VRYLNDSCALRAIGIDLSSIPSAERRREVPGILFVRASGLCLPFSDAVMDAVLAECSLSLMGNLDKALNECSRVLKPGGSLLVHDLFMQDRHAGAKIKSPAGCRLTGVIMIREWIEKLEGGGFSVAFWEDHTRALKEFAARLIFSHGSLEAFWPGARSADGMEQAGEIHYGASSANPGYFLAVAKKSKKE
jgi:SAM-dependent methyltransferase